MLVIDNGNTRTKFAIYHDGKRCFDDKIVNTELAKQLDEQWLDRLKSVLKDDTNCVACRVGEGTSAAIIEQRLGTIGIEVHWLTSQSQQLGVTNGYGEQATLLGADRWFAMLGYHQQQQQNALIIDAGTALTIDWLTAAGEHLGGWIVPGRRLMQESLHKGTANLKALLSESCYRQPATNTQQGMSYGVHYALVGAIAQALNSATQLFGQNNYQVVVTGGDGERLLKSLQAVESVTYQRIDDLVFKGLLAAADTNSN